MSWHVVAANTVADSVDALARLQPVAERVFGAGDRPAGWFARKLAREAVDPALTQLAMPDDAPGDLSRCLGYVLLGRPPSRAPAARTAGTGVVPGVRGRGLGTALLEAAAHAAAAAGCEALELWAERALEDFYRGRGFALVRQVSTLLAFAHGPGGVLPPALPWADAAEAIELHAYLPEAWSNTDRALRHSLRFVEHDACVHVCREGRAFVVHRTTTARPEHADRLFAALLAALPAGAPVLAVAMPEVSSVTASLRDAGWLDVQRVSILRRALPTRRDATTAATGQATGAPR